MSTFYEQDADRSLVAMAAYASGLGAPRPMVIATVVSREHRLLTGPARERIEELVRAQLVEEEAADRAAQAADRAASWTHARLVVDREIERRSLGIVEAVEVRHQLPADLVSSLWLKARCRGGAEAIRRAVTAYVDRVLADISANAHSGERAA